MNTAATPALLAAPDGAVEAAVRFGGTGLSRGPSAGRFLPADTGRFL